MNMVIRYGRTWMLSMILCTIGLLVAGDARAHCDTMDGPVVSTARAALEKGDVTPVLKWVRKEDESEIREQFQKTLLARKQGREARELADRYFFETLVRIHRAGEGAPYTGLRSEPAEAIIRAADTALEGGSAADLVKHMSDAVTKGIQERFAKTLERKKHAGESVDKGRAFVEAYVEFTHYVERLDRDAGGAAHTHGDLPPREEHGHGDE